MSLNDLTREVYQTFNPDNSSVLSSYSRSCKIRKAGNSVHTSITSTDDNDNEENMKRENSIYESVRNS